MQVPDLMEDMDLEEHAFQRIQKLCMNILSLKSPLHILKKVIDLNNDIRGSYKSSTDRENDQNINFLKD